MRKKDLSLPVQGVYYKRFFDDEMKKKMEKMWPDICRIPGQEMPLDFINESNDYGKILSKNFQRDKMLWIHGTEDAKVPLPMNGYFDTCPLGVYGMCFDKNRDNIIPVQNGTHELNTPEEISQYMDRLVQFLIF